MNHKKCEIKQKIKIIILGLIIFSAFLNSQQIYAQASAGKSKIGKIVSFFNDNKFKALILSSCGLSAKLMVDTYNEEKANYKIFKDMDDHYKLNNSPVITRNSCSATYPNWQQDGKFNFSNDQALDSDYISQNHYFYHWSIPLSQKILTTIQKFNYFIYIPFAYNNQFDTQSQGVGFYMAKKPTSSMGFGPKLTEIKIPKNKLTLRAVIYPSIDSNLEIENKNRDLTNYIYRYGEDWYVFKMGKYLNNRIGLDLNLGFSTYLPFHFQTYYELATLPINFSSFTGNNFDSPSLDYLSNDLEIKAKEKDQNFEFAAIIDEIKINRKFSYGCYKKKPICLEFNKDNIFIKHVPFVYCKEIDLPQMEKECLSKDYVTLKEVLSGPLSKKNPAPEINMNEFWQGFMNNAENTDFLRSHFDYFNEVQSICSNVSNYIETGYDRSVNIGITSYFKRKLTQDDLDDKEKFEDLERIKDFIYDKNKSVVKNYFYLYLNYLEDVWRMHNHSDFKDID